MLIISTNILVLFVTGFEVTEKQREILMKATVEYENDLSTNEEMVAFPSVVTPSPPPITGPDWRQDADPYFLLPYILFDPPGQLRLFAPKKENCIVICALKMEDVLCYQGEASMKEIM